MQVTINKCDKKKEEEEEDWCTHCLETILKFQTYFCVLALFFSYLQLVISDLRKLVPLIKGAESRGSL